jgi:apolipoprotein N-acyltransferase
LVAAAGGMLIASGGAPILAVGLPWAGIALLHLAYEQAWMRRSGWRGAWVGLAAGFAANAMTMGWAVDLFVEHAYMPYEAALGLACLLWLAQSLPFVVAGGLGAHLYRMLPAAERWLATPLALLIGGTLGAMFFPWRIGTSQTDFSAMASWARFGGVGLVDLFLAWPVVMAVEALRSHRARLGGLALGSLLLALGGGALLHRMATSERDAAPVLSVGIAHTILSIDERRNTMRWEANHIALQVETASLEAEGADLVLWPETAYAFQWPRSRRRDGFGIESVRSGRVHGPVVFGSVSYDRAGRWNSVVGMDEHGDIVGIVDKRVLMPFSERIPFYEWLEPWHRELPRSLTPAPGPGVIELGPIRVGILNCYEDLSDEHTRWLSHLDPSFLANHTNDAWFGAHGAELHMFLSRLRAIETGRDLVRAVNGGVSAHIAWTGEVVGRREIDEPAGLLAEVRVGEGRTLFVVLGDWVGMGAVGMYLALLLAARKRAARG